jgi:DNA-binding NarL/FixJ family response regulator
MDLKMPGVNGIDATRIIHEKYPNVGVLVITMFDDDDSVFAAMRAGALGYLLKDADRDELVRAIVAVKKGEAIFSPAIARRMIQYFNSAPGRQPSPGKGQADEFDELTEREREILDMIAHGHDNHFIASKLNLSIKTVQNYVSSILMKLQVADRAKAIIRAREAGFGKTLL